MSSTGRRPNRSDSRPMMGAATSCISEYTATSSPTAKGEAPKRTPYTPSCGIRMPNPMRSRTAMPNTTRSDASRANFALPRPFEGPLEKTRPPERAYGALRRPGRIPLSARGVYIASADWIWRLAVSRSMQPLVIVYWYVPSSSRQYSPS
ncbi:hypothetical protein COEX109129_30725 [Corallococcus exiguus]